MKSDVETLSPTRVKLTVEVPFEELKPALDAAYKRIAAQVTVPGFRKGKVPARIIDQRFGRAAVLEEAVNEAVRQHLDAAVREHDLKLARPTRGRGRRAQGQRARSSSPPRPTSSPSSTCPTTTGIEVSVDAAEVDRRGRRRAARRAARPLRHAAAASSGRAQTGDVLLFDLAGASRRRGGRGPRRDGAVLRGRRRGDASPGSTTPSRGAVADEVRTFTFPPEVGEYEGKDIDVTVTVTTVRERELPDADDDFAQLASEFDTIDELRGRPARAARPREAPRAGRTQAREKVAEAAGRRRRLPAARGRDRRAGRRPLPRRARRRRAPRRGRDAGARARSSRQLVLDRIADKEQVVGQRGRAVGLAGAARPRATA